jgi:hypothetical protein
VTNLGAQAFSRCSNLKSVYFYGDAPSSFDTVFLDITPIGTVYYIAGSAGWNSTFGGWPTQALSQDTDTDGDGLNDVAEFLMSDLGFNWELAQANLVSVFYSNANRAKLYSEEQYNANRSHGQADVTANPSAFNLFTAEQYVANYSNGMNAVLSDPASHNLYTSDSIMDLRMNGLMVQKQGGNAVVSFQPQTSTDLTQPFTNNGTPITNTIPMPGNRGFLRIQAGPAATPTPTPPPVVPST